MTPIHEIRRDDPGSWALMPGVLVRVGMFCRKYDTDTKAEEITQRVMEHFVVEEKRQTVRVWVSTQRGELVGHCLVTVDDWCGTKIATIAQYESDVPLDRAEVVRAFDDIAAWARRKGATKIRLLTLHTDARGLARARLFSRIYGFRPTHMVCDRDL